jgi:hypothetical protein
VKNLPVPFAIPKNVFIPGPTIPQGHGVSGAIHLKTIFPKIFSRVKPAAVQIKDNRR